MEIKKRLSYSNILFPLNFVPQYLFPIGGDIRFMSGWARWIIRNQLARGLRIERLGFHNGN